MATSVVVLVVVAAAAAVVGVFVIPFFVRGVGGGEEINIPLIYCWIHLELP